MDRFELPVNGPAREKDIPTHERRVVADAEDVLWQKFGNATSAEEFYGTWLALQCRKIDGIAAGVLLLGSPKEGQPYAPVAFWPDRQFDSKHLADVAERALTERRGLTIKRQNGPDRSSPPRYHIAYPLQVAGQVYGIIALDADSRPQEALRHIVRQLQWGAGWMEALFHRRQSAGISWAHDRLQAVVSILSTVVSHKSFDGAVVAFVTELATRFSCDRVSLGFVRRGSTRVKAVSHTAQFGTDTNLLRAIGVAMDEALDQQAAIVFPSSKPKAVVTRAHSELARHSGNGAICSVPLNGPTDTVGIITFERTEDKPFDQEMVQLFESISALVGPVLEVQRRDDRWLLSKAIDATNAQLRAVIGPRHVAMKLALFVIVTLALFLTFARGNYRVTAKTVIEPASRQAVVAAYDGYINTANVRAGDLVRKNQLLAQLDDRKLKLERSKWQSQQEQSLRQYYEALGNRNAAQVQILTAQVAQARAQVALLDEEIARTKVIAPVDGVIVTGDLSQSLGAPIERGQVLFELAPLDSYRIVLQVDERQIGDVAVGQRGRLILAGFADDPLDFSVGRFTPVSTASEGRNFFRVEARLENVPERLRPGMEGVGKIEIDRRRLIWIWTHEVVDWLRLKTWNWLP